MESEIKSIEEKFWIRKADETFVWIMSINFMMMCYAVLESIYPYNLEQRVISIVCIILTMICILVAVLARRNKDPNKYFACIVFQMIRLMVRPWDFENTRPFYDSNEVWYGLVTFHYLCLLLMVIIVMFQFKYTKGSKIFVIFTILMCVVTGYIGIYGRD